MMESEVYFILSVNLGAIYYFLLMFCFSFDDSYYTTSFCLPSILPVLLNTSPVFLPTYSFPVLNPSITLSFLSPKLSLEFFKVSDSITLFLIWLADYNILLAFYFMFIFLLFSSYLLFYVSYFCFCSSYCFVFYISFCICYGGLIWVSFWDVDDFRDWADCGSDCENDFSFWSNDFLHIFVFIMIYKMSIMTKINNITVVISPHWWPTHTHYSPSSH